MLFSMSLQRLRVCSDHGSTITPFARPANDEMRHLRQPILTIGDNSVSSQALARNDAVLHPGAKMVGKVRGLETMG